LKYLLALLLTSLPLIPLEGAPPALRAVREFRSKNLGLFDVSSDGTLLLMHETGKSSIAKTSFKVYVLNAANYREVSSISVELPRDLDAGKDPSYSRQMFFMPESHLVVLVGTTRNSKDPPALLIWNPVTDAIDRIPGLVNEKTFIADVWDRDRLLCYTTDYPRKAPMARARGRKFFLYSLSTRQAEPIDIRDDEYQFDSEHPVVRSPDGKKIVARVEGAGNALEIHNIPRNSFRPLALPADRHIASYRYSPDGKYLAIVSVRKSIVAGTENGTKDITDVPFLSIYDAVSEQVSDQRILDHIHPYAKKRYKLPAAEDYLASTGQLMRYSDDGRKLVISFCVGSRNTGRQSAQFAVFDFPSLALLGVAHHPDVKLGASQYVGASAAGGRLHFSPDNRLFTTSKYAIAWSVPD
jgi:hypothetical protein